MGLLLLRDLQYRKWRVLLTVVLMAIVMTLLFIMSGLVGQFNAEPELATRFIGDDRQWVVPAGAGGPITNPQAVPLDEFPEVLEAEAVVIQPSQLNGERVYVAGRDFSRPGNVARNLDAGRMPNATGEIVVDERLGLEVGDTATLGTSQATVVGVLDDATVLAGVSLVFTTVDFAQESVGAGLDIAMATLTTADNPSLPPAFAVMTPEEVAAETLKPLENAISSVTLVRALLWLITAIVIAAVVYITALERTRDFAVLKAVGGRNRALAGSLLIQGVIMTLLAVGIAAVLQTFVAPAFPMIVRIPDSAWWQVPVFGAVIAVVAGMAGVHKVHSTSPSEAFG